MKKEKPHLRLQVGQNQTFAEFTEYTPCIAAW